MFFFLFSFKNQTIKSRKSVIEIYANLFVTVSFIRGKIPIFMLLPYELKFLSSVFIKLEYGVDGLNELEAKEKKIIRRERERDKNGVTE